MQHPHSRDPRFPVPVNLINARVCFVLFVLKCMNVDLFISRSKLPARNVGPRDSKRVLVNSSYIHSFSWSVYFQTSIY
jgi:hypothetical protein